MDQSLIDILNNVARAGGISGLFAVIFALACWKLYRDLMRCKDARLTDLKKNSRDVNETLRRLDRMMEKLYEWLISEGR